MLEELAKVGDIVWLKSDASVWIVESVDANGYGTISCVEAGQRWRIGERYVCQKLTLEWWDFVEDDFDRWVREVREENGSDLCSLRA